MIPMGLVGETTIKPTTVDHIESTALLDLVLAGLDADKADDVVVIDLEGKSTMADYMVVATGTSQRHLAAMGDKLVQALKAGSLGDPVREGQGDSGWHLIDAGAVIVHLFRAETRTFYDLEKLWSVSPPKRQTAAAP